MNVKHDFLLDKNGKDIIAYHGTYYVFDYFLPLSHFGSKQGANTVLNEGKWKRDKNIDITKPLIIPVHLKYGNYMEIPDLNDHYVQDWRAIVLCLLQDATIISDINHVEKWQNIEQKCNRVASKPLTYQYDFICEPIKHDIDINQIKAELSCDCLYDKATNENLFFQRMILFLESIGIDGFVYANFTECAGQNSYIVFRSNNVIRLDKNVAPMVVHQDINALNDIQSRFKAGYRPRCMDKAEKDSWIKKLHDFYDFRIAEMARQHQNPGADK